jgi:endogenous inhibitor of DNA gyrase (YacG/DUF329 family)
MAEDFETPDLSEFLAACSKEFCPWCGKPMERNLWGRPRIFCSNRCRWVYNSWKHRKREREKNEVSNSQDNTGDGAEAGGV